MAVFTTGKPSLSNFAKPLFWFSTAIRSIPLASLKSPDTLLKIVAPLSHARKYLGSLFVKPSTPKATPSASMSFLAASASLLDKNTTFAPFCIAFFSLLLDLPLKDWLSKTNSKSLPFALSPLVSAQNLVSANSSTASIPFEPAFSATFAPAFTAFGISFVACL